MLHSIVFRANTPSFAHAYLETHESFWERNGLIHLLQVFLITPLKRAILFLLTSFLFYLFRIRRLNCLYEKVSLFLNLNLLSMKTIVPLRFLCFDVLLLLLHLIALLIINYVNV